MSSINIEKEIRECFDRMGISLAEVGPVKRGWQANSQYGYCLKAGFETKTEAEKYTLAYYAERMQLIRQEKL